MHELCADPTISAATVTAELGVRTSTAQTALTRLRADRIADRVDTDPSLTPHQAAVALGYPAGQVRRATTRAQPCSAPARVGRYKPLNTPSAVMTTPIAPTTTPAMVHRNIAPGRPEGAPGSGAAGGTEAAAV